MTGLATNAQLRQGCSGVVLPGNSGMPSCSLHGCSRRNGLVWRRSTHPARTEPLGVPSSPARSTHLSDCCSRRSEGTGERQKIIFSCYVAVRWREGLLPETLAKLQIHHRSSAVTRPVHKQLPKTLDPCRVPGILQAVAAVCDQSCSTDMSLTSLLTVTTSDMFSFVFHYSGGFLRVDGVMPVFQNQPVIQKSSCALSVFCHSW